MEGLYGKLEYVCISSERRNARKGKMEESRSSSLISISGPFFPNMIVIALFASLSIDMWVKIINYFFDPVQDNSFQVNIKKLIYMQIALPENFKLSNRSFYRGIGVRRSPFADQTFQPLIHQIVKKNMWKFLDLFHVSVEMIMILLKTTQAFICGSFALQCILGNHFQSKYIDIFVDESNLQLFEETVRDLMGNFGFEYVQNEQQYFEYGNYHPNIHHQNGRHCFPSQYCAGKLIQINCFQFGKKASYLAFKIFVVKMDVNPLAKPPTTIQNFSPHSDLTLTSIAIGVDHSIGDFYCNIDNYEDLAFHRLYPKGDFYCSMRDKWLDVMVPSQREKSSFKMSLTASNGFVFAFGNRDLRKLEMANDFNNHLHRLKKVLTDLSSISLSSLIFMFYSLVFGSRFCFWFIWLSISKRHG